MRTSALTLLAAASGLSSAVAAVGNAVVQNNCAVPVYIWSVDSTVSPEYTVQPQDSYSEVLHSDPQTGGVAIKVTTVDGGLYNGSPETVFAYSLTGAQVWYDLSDVFGDAFASHSLSVTPSDTSCGTIAWPNGTPPAGSQTHVCESDSNITLTLC